MVHLVIVGNPSDKRIFLALKSALQNRAICSICEQGVDSVPEPPDFLLVQTASLQQIVADNTILIFKDQLDCKKTISYNGSVIAVVNSQHLQSVQLAAGSRLNTITCGLSARDTLTLSSNTSDSAVICLQRSISTLSGCILEPGEFPIALSHPADSYSLLATAAALLLCDELPLLQHLVI